VYANPSVTKLTQLGEKLTAGWVFGVSEADTFNLVCGQNRWIPTDITWTEEGAEFNGVTSKMILENVTFTNSSLGLTWLLRLTREPEANLVFLETMNCNSTKPGAILFEYPDPNQLFFSTESQFGVRKNVKTQPIMTSDSTKFINIGVTGVPATKEFHLFHDRKFASITEDFDYSGDSGETNFNCLRLGLREADGFNFLEGTLRAVAIAHHVMTETEINKFFEFVA
jgi:hypothetical protein